MITKFEKFNFNPIMDVSGSMGSSSSHSMMSIIWEVEYNNDEKRLKYTGQQILTNDNERNILLGKNLIFVLSEKYTSTDYVYLRENRKKIEEILELERISKKYNI